jgi:rhamnosyltransferase subunit B
VKALADVAETLAAHGFHPVFAVREPAVAHPYAGRFPVLLAPRYRPASKAGGAPFRAASFADILAIRGFAHPDILTALVNDWQEILHRTRADLAVCEFSPVLTLAAYGVLPVLQLGSGFTVPPANGQSFPVLDAGAPPGADPKRLLEAIHNVQHRRGLPSPETLPQLFASASRFVHAVPEIDPYHSLRRHEHVGPMRSLPAPQPLPLEPTFFGYLKADFTGFALLLGDIAKAGLRGTVYLGGANADTRACLQNIAGIQILDRLPDLGEILPRVSAVLHHGGAGVTQAALAMGRPQVVLPQYLEQELTGQALERLGVGCKLTGVLKRSQVIEAITHAVADKAMRSKAIAIAEDIGRRQTPPLLPAIVQQSVALVAAG